MCIYTSGSFEEHLIAHLEQVLNRLRNTKLTVNPSKMTLTSDSISFLGHVFANNCITISNERVQPIADFPAPKNLKQLAKFLGGGVAFYSRFFKNFAEIFHPLNYFKRKGIPFRWTSEQQTAFDTLKRTITIHLLCCVCPISIGNLSYKRTRPVQSDFLSRTSELRRFP